MGLTEHLATGGARAGGGWGGLDNGLVRKKTLENHR